MAFKYRKIIDATKNLPSSHFDLKVLGVATHMLGHVSGPYGSLDSGKMCSYRWSWSALTCIKQSPLIHLSLGTIVLADNIVRRPPKKENGWHACTSAAGRLM